MSYEVGAQMTLCAFFFFAQMSYARLLAIPTFCILLFWLFLHGGLVEEQYMFLLQNMLF